MTVSYLSFCSPYCSLRLTPIYIRFYFKTVKLSIVNIFSHCYLAPKLCSHLEIRNVIIKMCENFSSALLKCDTI